MSLDQLLANAGVIWLAAAVLLGGAELVVPGVFLIFLAIAAAITGVALIALPGLPLLLQLVSFGLWSAATIAIGKRWYVDYPVTTSDPMLNDRAARMIGDVVRVIDPITGGAGRVLVGDGVWPARGPDAPAGTRMRVTGVEGSTLTVVTLPDPDATNA